MQEYLYLGVDYLLSEEGSDNHVIAYGCSIGLVRLVCQHYLFPHEYPTRDKSLDVPDAN